MNLLLIAIAFVILSEIILFLFVLFLKEDKTNPITGQLVTVLIPARNEEEHIKNAIQSLLRQSDVPLEILVGDDSSTDETAQIVRSIGDTDSRVKYFLIEDSQKKIGGKAGVLDILMTHVNGDIVLIADGDMTYDSDWAKNMSGFVGDACLVSSFTRVEGKGIWAQWQNLDWLLNLSGVKMLSGLGFNLTAVGNNMGFPVSAYKKVPGFSKMKGYLTEDMELLNQMKEAGVIHRIVFSDKTLGATNPAPVLRDLIAQRLRWMSGAFTSPIWLIIGWFLRVMILPMGAVLIFMNLKIALVVIALHWLLQVFIIIIITMKLGVSLKWKALVTFDFFYFFLNLSCLVTYFSKNEIIWKGRHYTKKDLRLKEN